MQLTLFHNAKFTNKRLKGFVSLRMETDSTCSLVAVVVASPNPILHC